MNRKSDDPIALQVRMTEGLRAKLAKAAEQNGRSLNAEILWRLGQTFPEERPRLGLRPLNWSPPPLSPEQVKELVEQALDERGIGTKKKKEG
jgi:hypothetical protein